MRIKLGPKAVQWKIASIMNVNNRDKATADS